MNTQQSEQPGKINRAGRLIFVLTLAFTIVLILMLGLQAQESAVAQPTVVAVGLITDEGGLSYMSFNWLSYQGLLRAESELGVTSTVYTSTNPEDYGPKLQQCVDEGNDLCISVGWPLSVATLEAANANPGTDFAIVDISYESYPSNLRGMTFAEKQVGYLAGVLAGYMTENGVIGAVAGAQFVPAVVDFAEGYRNGAQCANPAVNVLIEYTGTFTDSDLGAQVAQDMIVQGADAIFAIGGMTGIGGVITATQSGVWGIGVDIDFYEGIFENGALDGSDKVLSSAMKRLDNAVFSTISEFVAGTFTSGTAHYDLSVDGVGLAPFHQADPFVSQGVRNALDSARQGIINGSIDIDDPCTEVTPVVSAINPGKGLNDVPVSVLIEGAYFTPKMTAWLSNGTTDIQVEGLLFIGSTRLRGTIPVGILPGVYDLVVSDGFGADFVLPGAYQALDPATSDDLLVADETDLWSDPPSIQAGATLTLGLTVRRQGGAGELAGVNVSFYLGAPLAANLIEIGTTDPIAINGTGVATVSWTPDQSGYQTLYAQINHVDDDPGNNLISRTVRVLPADIPHIPPTVDSLTINAGAPDSASPDVVLDVSAPGASHLLYVEYEYIQSRHDWVPTAISEWLPYGEAAAGYPWKLQPAPGVHYLQVWAADQNGLISLEPGVSLINYLPPTAYAATGQIYIYRYNLVLQDVLLARLTSLSWPTGDADLYAWDPQGNFIEPTDETQPVEVVTITASLDGIYQLEVEGYTPGDFLLEVNPVPVFKTNVMDAFEPDMPVIRGRGRPLTVALPDKDIGLPQTPREWIFLPLLSR